MIPLPSFRAVEVVERVEESKSSSPRWSFVSREGGRPDHLTPPAPPLTKGGKSHCALCRKGPTTSLHRLHHFSSTPFDPFDLFDLLFGRMDRRLCFLPLLFSLFRFRLRWRNAVVELRVRQFLEILAEVFVALGGELPAH